VQLTYFSDYALRLLIYLGAHADRLVSIQEVSRAYGISQHHLVKVVQLLVENGLVATTRGRRGGMRLNLAPEQIRVGELVRLTEPHFHLVECFDTTTNTCPIEPACGLKGVFQQAGRAFLEVLDAHTLADFLPRAPTLVRLWKRSEVGQRPGARVIDQR
jgi:Rrf2 family nitric oxide-sensitive transcriptional repressor